MSPSGRRKSCENNAHITGHWEMLRIRPGGDVETIPPSGLEGDGEVRVFAEGTREDIGHVEYILLELVADPRDRLAGESLGGAYSKVSVLGRASMAAYDVRNGIDSVEDKKGLLRVLERV